MRDIVSPLSGFGSPFGQRRDLLNATAIARILFSDEEPGFFYDFDDWSTLFQDTAGTQPVTAPNQGVALALDKSGNDNHATQATTAARPLTARHPDGGVRNVLPYQSDDYSSGNTGVTRIVTEISHPLGTPGGQVVRLTATEGETSRKFHGHSTLLDVGILYDIVKSEGIRYVAYGRAAADGQGLAVFDLQEGTIVRDSFLGGATILALGGGWFRVSTPVPSGPTNDTRPRLHLLQTNEGTGDYEPWVGDGTSILLAGRQLELSGLSPYQRRVNHLDVTEAGKKSIRRLWFNGTSHFMTTPVITPNTDKAQVFAGVRKLSDAGTGVLAQLGEFSNSGEWTLRYPRSSSQSEAVFGTRDSVARVAVGIAHASPASSVLTATSDRGAPSLNILRRNGVSEGTNSEFGSTINFAGGAIDIGSQGGTSLFFNGYIDQLITRFGANLDTATIEKTEKYVSTKSPEVPTL